MRNWPHVVVLLPFVVPSQNMHSAHNMQWQAIKQRKGGKEQLEKQAHPSDIPNLAQHEYYSNMGDFENQGN